MFTDPGSDRRESFFSPSTLHRRAFLDPPTQECRSEMSLGLYWLHSLGLWLPTKIVAITPFPGLDMCNQLRIHIFVGRWKRGGVIVVLFSTDHDPRHVHVFEDGKRLLKFNLESWAVMEGTLTSKSRKALEALRKEGAFDEKPNVQGD